MKRELFGGVFFVGIFVGFNYILRHVLDHLANEETIKQDNTTQELTSKQDITQETTQDTTQELTPTQDITQETTQDTTQEVIQEITTQDTTQVDIIKLLEKRRNLVSLNDRLFDIKRRLQCLKNDLNREECE